MTTNLQYPSNIAAAWTKRGREAFVATYAWTQSGGCLHVYTFSKISPSNVESDEWKASLGIIVDDVSGSGAYRGITSSTQIVQHMVGIVAIRRPDNNAEGTQVWVYLVNSVTKRSYSTRVHAFEFFSKFPVLHISPDLRYFLLIVGHYGAQDDAGDHREGVKDSMPSQFIQVYRIPPEVSSTHSHEDTVVPDNMGPLVISTSKLFDSIPMAQYRTSPTITPSANISLLQGDTYLDSLNVLHIFQPCVKGQGAYVARFSIDIDSGRKTITQTYCSLVAIDLICRSQFVSTPACMVSRGLFYAEVRLPDGLAKKLFRYRLPTDLENQVNTLRSRETPANLAVSSLDIQDVNDPEGDAPITFAYDEAGGRICQSSVGGQDEERVYRLTIADMV
ncbi:hypothetical protein ONZ45_g18578 [Pleurotus djamor]|nr:hypothetical protein ONZ45_g18578 [Pleurotus djamor]